MYRVIVCEDDPLVGESLVCRTREILQRMDVSAVVTLYLSADALQKDLFDGLEADLFLLDIRMEGTSGLTLAQQLYDQGVRDKVIFITGYAEYALEGYSAHPLHYLLKPVDDASLEEALQLAWSLHRPKNIVLQKGRRTFSLPLDEVLYLESKGHDTMIHFSHDTRQFPLSLTEVETLLPQRLFAHSHKSYLINLTWVEEIVRNSVRLRNGVVLPVSRSYYLAFQAAFVSYLNTTA